MKVKLKSGLDCEAFDAAFEKNKEYEELSIEKGWYRIMTELDEDYLFPSDIFDITDSSNIPPVYTKGKKLKMIDGVLKAVYQPG